MTSDWKPGAWPIVDHDGAREALIEPARVIPRVALPERCVISFFGEQIARLLAQGSLRQVTEQRSGMGVHPVYVLRHNGDEVALFHPGLGAPFAAALLEEVIARGCNRFVVCGSAGVLDRTIARGHLLVPSAALRDEGTSYHYLPPSRQVCADAEAVAAIEAVLAERGIAWLRTTTWTTDAYYRETPARIAARRAEGCLCVEMECAALFAVAQFRGVRLGALLSGGDDVSGTEWDLRDWQAQPDVRARMIALAAEAVLRL
jgi:uridine phosphorylase